MYRTPAISLLVLCLAAPIATADEGTYAGAGVVTGMCADDASASDTGLVCDLECNWTCVVTVTDDVLGDGAHFQVCDWDGEANSNCSGIVTGPYTHASSTGIVDVFIAVGTTGTASTAPTA